MVKIPCIYIHTHKFWIIFLLCLWSNHFWVSVAVHRQRAVEAVLSCPQSQKTFQIQADTWWDCGTRLATSWPDHLWWWQQQSSHNHELQCPLTSQPFSISQFIYLVWTQCKINIKASKLTVTSVSLWGSSSRRVLHKSLGISDWECWWLLVNI